MAVGQNAGMHPLVEEAMKKASIAWLGAGDRDRYAVWCLWQDGGLYVVSGPGEQPAPGLASASSVTVTARGEHGGRIVTWPARVDRVRPDTDEWASVVPALAGKRLNAAGAEELTQRWARECVVSRLTPAGPPTEAGPSLPTGAGAAPVPETPAVRETRMPFRLHRVRKPR